MILLWLLGYYSLGLLIIYAIAFLYNEDLTLGALVSYAFLWPLMVLGSTTIAIVEGQIWDKVIMKKREK